MSFSVICPQCGKAMKVKDELAGRRGKCPTCQAVFRMPGEKKVKPLSGAPLASTPAAPPAPANPLAFDAPPANPFVFDAPGPSAEPPRPKQKPALPPAADARHARQKPNLPPSPPANAGNPFAFDTAPPAATPPRQRKGATPPVANAANPFAFGATPVPPAENTPRPARNPLPAAPAAPKPADADNPFAFTTAAPTGDPFAFDPSGPTAEHGPVISAARSGGRSSQSRSGLPAGTWDNVASSCTPVQIGALVFAVTQLVGLVVARAVKPTDPVSVVNAFLLVVLLTSGGSLLACLAGIVGRVVAKRVPDQPAAGLAGFSALVGLLGAGALGLAFILALLLRVRAVTNPDAVKAIVVVMGVALLVGILCFCLAEALFARVLRRVAVVKQYPPLGGWGLSVFIGWLVALGLYLLVFLIALIGSLQPGRAAVASASDLEVVVTVLLIVLVGVYHVPLIRARAVLRGRIEPGRAGPAQRDQVVPPEQPFSLDDEPDDRDERTRRRR